MFLHNHTFADRAQAGVALGGELQRQFSTWPSAPILVVALPRGGVPVAYEVARVLHAPLDVLVVRKVGLPEQPEVAIGAIASGGIVVRDTWAAKRFPELAGTFAGLAAKQRHELERREKLYRPGLAPLQMTGKMVLLVDDGLATGCTMLAAVRAARKAGAGAIVVAAPVASPRAAALVGAEADATVILQTPATLNAVGEWYRDFEQLDDAEVRRLLNLSRPTAAGSAGHPPKRSARS